MHPFEMLFKCCKGLLILTAQLYLRSGKATSLRMIRRGLKTEIHHYKASEGDSDVSVIVAM